VLRTDVLQVSSTSQTQTLWTALVRDVDRYLTGRVEASAVEDLRQEVLARAASHLDSLRDDEAVGAWVLRIAHNVVVDHLRRRRRIEPPDENTPDRGLEDLDDADPAVIAAAVLGPWLQATIDTLPAVYADALRRVELQGQSQKEAAAELDISYSAFKSRVQRGRSMLRDALLRCCDVERDVRGRVIDWNPRPVDDEGSCC
jgi:RNA polymerase sigma-70 factor (ECF subfamily)